MNRKQRRFQIFNDLKARAKGNPAPLFIVRNEADKPAEILIYDSIGRDDWTGEGFSAKDFASALASINEDRELHIRVNSRGGLVDDGIAIYNRLKEWKGKTVAKIDGSAASIASVLIMGADEIHMARSAEILIHEAHGVGVGDADDFRQMASRLDAASDRIAEIYAAKTGRRRETMRKYMRETTSFNGEAALEAGLVDVLNDEASLYNFSPQDIEHFRVTKPGEPTNAHKPNAAASRGQPTQATLMNRDEMIAMLKEHGIAINNEVSDTDLLNKFKEAFKKKTEPPPAAPVQNASPELEARMKALEDERRKVRKSDVQNRLQACVDQRRITVDELNASLDICVEDSADKLLNAFEKREPQEMPIGVRPEITGTASIHDITKRAGDLRNEVRALVASASERAGSAAKVLASFVTSHRERIIQIWNEGTNTIDSDLKQDVLLRDALMQFKKIIMPLTVFAKNIGAQPLRGTTTIRVQFIPIDTVAATTWNAANGYVAGDTAVEERALTLTRYYKAIRFTADELARQPFLMLNETFQKAAERLGYDVWLGFLGVITAANYTTVAAGWPKAVGAFDSNGVADLRNEANKAQWPFPGRSLIVNSDYDNALLKDNAVKQALNYGGSEAIRQGRIPELFGFQYLTNPNWPTNSENLVGIIAQENAVLVGSSPIAPTEEELRAGLVYNFVSDPELGISLEYKSFGQPQMNRAFRIIEANWAAGKGDANNLQRLTSA